MKRNINRKNIMNMQLGFILAFAAFSWPPVLGQGRDIGSPANLVLNGDFGSGLDYWTVYYPDPPYADAGVGQFDFGQGQQAAFYARVGGGMPAVLEQHFIARTGLIYDIRADVASSEYYCCENVDGGTVSAYIYAPGMVVLSYSFGYIHMLETLHAQLSGSFVATESGEASLYIGFSREWGVYYSTPTDWIGNIRITALTTSQAVQRLMSQVEGSEVRNSKALTATLSAALASIEKGNPAASANQLRAFMHQVRSQVVDPGRADRFIEAAQLVVNALQS
jgi:hypothetical protein